MRSFVDNITKCPQLLIYLFLAFTGVAVSFFFTEAYFVRKNGSMSISTAFFIHIFQIFIMSTLFYILCKYDYGTVAWILLLFPVIVGILMVLVLIGTFGVLGGIKEKEEQKEQKEQNAIEIDEVETTNNNESNTSVDGYLKVNNNTIIDDNVRHRHGNTEHSHYVKTGSHINSSKEHGIPLEGMCGKCDKFKGFDGDYDNKYKKL
jgi:hypothetical protein|tara:strand:+ start:584 stop:1198 length:615 start_codon:yes stop_codon:yes gene_type:complete